jgi:hypothetical protein
MMSKSNPPDSNLNNFNPNENKEVKELTHKALINFLKEEITNKHALKKDLDALNSTISEYLNCFILLGYNCDGDPVQTIFAHNQQEADSLGTLVNKFMFSTREKDDDRGDL